MRSSCVFCLRSRFSPASYLWSVGRSLFKPESSNDPANVTFRMSGVAIAKIGTRSTAKILTDFKTLL